MTKWLLLWSTLTTKLCSWL